MKKFVICYYVGDTPNWVMVEGEDELKERCLFLKETFKCQDCLVFDFENKLAVDLEALEKEKREKEHKHIQKALVVDNIEWDAPRDVRLPKKIVINVEGKKRYLLEDVDGYAENLLNYLSDKYGYCLKGFRVYFIHSIPEQNEVSDKKNEGKW